MLKGGVVGVGRRFPTILAGLAFFIFDINHFDKEI
jgi:hypothetical protein